MAISRNQGNNIYYTMQHDWAGKKWPHSYNIWSRDYMATILQMIFVIIIPWQKMPIFWLQFHWNVLHRAQLIIIHHWFTKCLGAMQVTRHFLTQWGRVMHIWVGKLTTIASDNGLSPGRHDAIIWNNAGILLIGPLGINLSEILIEIQTFHWRKYIWKCCLWNVGHFVWATMC